MSTVEAALREALDSPGVVRATLVDAVTGLTYGAVGSGTAAGDGAELAELTTLVAGRMHEAGTGGELESLVITTARAHHVVQLVPRRGDALVLAVVLDRASTNLALAIRQVADLAKAVLA
ncbi:hypothetical protein [Kitasatospora sp. NPDC094015]|uniref:hypothetical protein n=1 Tax=Kitasatospora sp. NPDC094015 TaxID=3155205 RepID=UPI00332A7A00